MCGKQAKMIKHLCHQKKIFVCMYKMHFFALFTANAWRKNNVEVIEYVGEIWINKKP